MDGNQIPLGLPHLQVGSSGFLTGLKWKIAQSTSI
jgi:hypothetical protein